MNKQISVLILERLNRIYKEKIDIEIEIDISAYIYTWIDIHKNICNVMEIDRHRDIKRRTCFYSAPLLPLYLSLHITPLCYLCCPLFLSCILPLPSSILPPPLYIRPLFCLYVALSIYLPNFWFSNSIYINTVRDQLCVIWQINNTAEDNSIHIDDPDR